jgi:hypothetical protein
MKLLRVLRLLWSYDSDAEMKAVDLNDGLEQSLEDDAIAVEGVGLSPMKLAASAVDVAVSLGPVTTAKRLFILSDQAITVKLNGSDDALALVPAVAGSADKEDWAVFYIEADVTEIQLSNPASAIANVLYALAGV